MRSRFPLVALLLTFVLLSGAALQNTTGTAVARQTAAVSETEALPALAYGQLSLVDPAARPANPPPSSANTDVLIGPPGLARDLLELDGTIAFASDRDGSLHLFTQDAGGGPAAPLVNSAGNDATPVWSPDGSQLVFASDRDGDFEIYLRPADGTERKLTDNTVQDIHPSWSPDGQRILFSSDQSGSTYQAYTIDLNGQNVQPVGDVENHVLYPRYAPDGSRIAFMRASVAIPACDWNWDIWLMDADGNNQLKVTTQLGGDLYPNWTPDGRIIYASCRNFFTSDLYIVDPNSGVESQATDWAGSELHGVYSPDSAHLAFNATNDGNYEIYISTFGDSTAFNFTENATADLTPSWDGQRVIPDPCAGADPSLQPILLAPGWGGADTIAQDGGGFEQMLPYLEAMGYQPGCNLFYAGETAANLSLYENGEKIRDVVCQAYGAIKKFNPGWSGHLDIIGHSFGGLRSRAFLEDARWYDLTGQDGAYCQPPYQLPPGEKLFIDNLFTLGSPHGGGTTDLPGALFLGAVHFLSGNWESIAELLFAMPTYNQAHEQPQKVCYWFVGGDAWAQPQTHTALGWLYSPLQKLTPNDLGVYRWSAQATHNFWPEQYQNVVRLDTTDMHGYLGLPPFNLIQSYVYPANTFNAIIRENLGADEARCQMFQPQTEDSRHRTPETPLVPTLVLATGELDSGAVASGHFQLTESGSTTIYLDWPSGEMDLSLTDPSGNRWTPATIEGSPNADYLEMTVLSNVATYVFTDTITGTWNYTITAATLPYEMPYRLVALPEPLIAVKAEATPWQQVGQPVVITGTVQLDDASRLVGAGVEALISRPDATTDRLPLFDDGAHQDGATGDGIYGNLYSNTALDGRYIATLRANGTYQGQAYTRTAEALFTVAPFSAALAGQYSEQPRDSNGDGAYDWLNVGVSLTVNEPGLYYVAADLVTLEGEFAAHALAQSDLATGPSQITLSFSGETIVESNRDGPYVLTNVMLVDAASGTVLVDKSTNAYQTATYNHTLFGAPQPIYLSFVSR